jgi:hypothetical protein
MSNSNIFHNNNFQQTSLNDAYNFSTFSEYIKNDGLKTSFSQTCIFCSSNNTINLTSEGGFKHCNNCKKQFRARLTNNK